MTLYYASASGLPLGQHTTPSCIRPVVAEKWAEAWGKRCSTVSVGLVGWKYGREEVSREARGVSGSMGERGVLRWRKGRRRHGRGEGRRAPLHQILKPVSSLVT